MSSLLEATPPKDGTGAGVLNPNLRVLPDYGVYDEGRYRERFDRIVDGLGGRATPNELESSYATVERVFRQYDGRQELDRDGSFAFIVPARIRRDSNQYHEDFARAFPIMRHLRSQDAFGLAVGLPPSIIDTYYTDEDSQRHGSVIFAPVFEDMREDLKTAERPLNLIRRIVNDAATFAHEKLGAQVIGLGATLPLYTNLGEKVAVPEGVTVTTGHGGTVWLIGETVRRVAEEKGLPSNTIGVIGSGGAIGKSSVSVLLDQFPNTQIVTFDKSKQDLDLAHKKSGRVTMAASNLEVLQQSSIIVSAITGTIDLEQMPGLDLTGKVIVDDSQPGCFTREQVERLGGKLVWVVGEDKSEDHRTTRVGGEELGLLGPSSVWGCNGEVASIAHTGANELAIRSRVTPEMARKIGEIMSDSSIVVASFESYAKAVIL